MSEDKRKHRRISLPLEVVWLGKSGKNEVRTGDVSASGCYIDTIIAVDVGERIALKLHLPSGTWIETLGEVVYHYPGIGFGVRFTRMSEAARQALEQFIAGQGG